MDQKERWDKRSLRQSIPVHNQILAAGFDKGDSLIDSIRISRF